MDGEIERPQLTMRYETICWLDDTTIEDDSWSYQVERARLSNGKVIYRYRVRLRLPDDVEITEPYHNGLPPTRATNNITTKEGE